MKSTKNFEQQLKNSKQQRQGCVGSSKETTPVTGNPRASSEFWGSSCEEFVFLVLVPLLECLKKRLCKASPELKREILSQIKVHEWRMKSKAELLVQLKELKEELAALEEMKFTECKPKTWAAPKKMSSMSDALARLSKL